MHAINTVRTGVVMCTILFGNNQLFAVDFNYLSSPLKIHSENA